MSTSALLSEEKSETSDAVPCCCDAVCLCLSSKPTLYGIQVADHLTTETGDPGDGLTLPTAYGMGRGLGVAALNRTHGTAATVL